LAYLPVVGDLGQAQKNWVSHGTDKERKTRRGMITEKEGRGMINLTHSMMIVVWMITMVAAMPLQAEIKLSDYNSVNKTEEFKLYIGGVGVGYGWANTALNHRSQPALYCQPGKLSLSSSNYVDILAREIEDFKNEYRMDTPV
jgi:hypothetical protein